MTEGNFVDYVKIYVSSGKGGKGSSHLHREKFIEKGGPDGGDGGRGGHVYIKGNKNLWTLFHLKFLKHLRAGHGGDGGSSRSTGHDGEDKYVEVPLGTVVKDQETGDVLFEITEHDEVKILAEGGKGGLGNWHFRSATNQTPRYAQPGMPVEEKDIIIKVDKKGLEKEHQEHLEWIKKEFPEEYVQLDNNTVCLEKCRDCKGTGKVSRPYRIALDIGAGGTRRAWPGYDTYTTDIRGDTKPDYVQDSRDLTLPHDHFDLVASSHHLEHIGRWDQERVWGEMFKICKPGGKIEHYVPNVQWSAAKIMSDEIDEHVMNVLYGAQEAHGYERIFNTHFFGYTAVIGKALAEAAGFVDVTTEDWRQNPNLGYNLIIRGRKPVEGEKVVHESGKLKARKKVGKAKKPEKKTPASVRRKKV